MPKRWDSSVNSLAPGKCQFNFRHVILKLTLVNVGWGISYEIALRWMPLELTDDKSTLVEVMAWCRQATSHYLSQCWLSPLLPYGIARPQWVKSLFHKPTDTRDKLGRYSSASQISWYSTQTCPQSRVSNLYQLIIVPDSINKPSTTK